MKNHNTLGTTLSTAFFDAWADTSIDCKSEVIIEFGNNAFNSTEATDQTATASSTKQISIFNNGGLLHAESNFWEPDQAFNNKNRNSMRWAVLDQGAKAWGSTSSYSPYRVVNIKDTGEQYEHGWWSAGRLSGSEHVTSAFAGARKINVITLYTDEAYPNMENITIQVNGSTAITATLGSSTYINTWYWNGSAWTYTTGTIPSYIANAVGVSCTSLGVTITSSYDVNAHARVSELQGYMFADASADVVSIQLDETREQYDTTVPVGVLKTASCTGVLQNVDQKYSAANTSGPYYPYIGENNRITVAFGVDTTRFGGSGYEYVQMGEYFVDQWQLEGSSLNAQFGTRDYGKFLQDALVPFSKVWQNSTVNLPFRDLLERSGKAPDQINIDPLALRVFPLLYVYNTSYWNFMAEVALADQGTFGFDGDGNFFYYTFSQLSNPPYTTSAYTFSEDTNLIDGTQTTNLVINIVLVDVHPIIQGDIGLQALFKESNVRNIKSKVITSVVTEEASASTLSWNYLGGSVGSTDLTIPLSLNTQNQNMLDPTQIPTINDFYFFVDNELIYCTSIDHTNAYVYPGNPLEPIDPVNNPTGRGWAGTTAASHTTGTYMGEAEYYRSVDYTIQPALSVTGVHCTAIDDLPAIIGLQQAKLIKFNYDLFQAELCIANMVPCYTPLVATDVSCVDPVAMFLHSGEQITDADVPNIVDRNLHFNWTTSIDGVALIQRPSARKAATANLTNKRLVRRHGKAEIEINNPWIQSQAHANQISRFMIDQYNVPRTMLSVRTVGLPFLDLSDRITISNWRELSVINRDFNIMNISYQYDGGLISTVALREILA